MVYQTERSNPQRRPQRRNEARRSGFVSERRSSEAIRSFRRKPPGRRRKRSERSLRRRPVGQEVKTGASHAPNVGSIPARVTIFSPQPLYNRTKVCYYALAAEGRKEGKALCLVSFLPESKSVSTTARVHPFPFRTRKLSSSVAKILVWRRTGKIARCRH